MMKTIEPEMIEVTKEQYYDLLRMWGADPEDHMLEELWTNVRFHRDGDAEAVVYGHDENVGTWTSTNGAQGVSIGDQGVSEDWEGFLDDVEEVRGGE